MHKTELVNPALSGVAEALLIPLYNRAMESQRPDAIMKDEKAVAIVTQMSYDFDQIRKIRMHEANKAARIMLTREIDRYTLDFLGRHPEFLCHRLTPMFLMLGSLNNLDR
jgi:O-methyltransferase involved in polyketide biosynthesis